MFSPEHMEALLKKIMDQLDSGVTGENNADEGQINEKNVQEKCLKTLTPSKIVVILGLLSGALSVQSVLVDKNQTVDILLEGSLKKKTQLEKIMDQVGKMPFDEVMKSVMGRF